MTSKFNPQPSKWRYWLRFHLPNFIYLLVLIAVAAGSYWLVKSNSNDTAAANPNKNPELVNAFASGLEVSQTGKNGQVSYIVTAKQADHFGTNNATVKDVTVTATPKDGGEVVTATATDGVWNDELHTVKLTGNVIINRAAAADSAAMHLSTELLNIDLYNDLASSDQAFEFNHGQTVANGTGFSYDYVLRDLKMGGTPNTRIKATLVNEAKTATAP